MFRVQSNDNLAEGHSPLRIDVAKRAGYCYDVFGLNGVSMGWPGSLAWG